MKSSAGSTAWAKCAVAALLTASTATAACTGRSTLVRRDALIPVPGVTWFAPADVADLASLDRWRLSVGPPVAVSDRGRLAESDQLVLVNWNTAIGAGDVAAMLADVRAVHGGEAPIVLLLQEVYRGGPEVPAVLASGAGFASRLRGLRSDGGRDEVESIGDALGMNVYYVPSMRNGAPGLSDEDRGNAILSTLPITDLAAVELPFERQRRVAVGATVTGRRAGGAPFRLRVVSAHLDNMVGGRRLWIAGSEFARARQARGLASLLRDETPLVLGADLNTWFGFSDQAYQEVAREFPGTRVTDARPTFRGLLRLDHLFYRLPAGWEAVVTRARSRYGSDHYPLVATIRMR